MCLSNLVLSGSGGVTLESQVVDCLTVATGAVMMILLLPYLAVWMLQHATVIIMQMQTEDDGSCEYAAENFDCDRQLYC